MSIPPLRLLPLFLASWLPSACISAETPKTSELWGVAGEKWSSESRLPDFSYAGYHSGEDPLPEVPMARSVKEFGATGDGETDDTEAFLQAIEACEGGAILVPAGRYRITAPLEIRKSGVVLRGEGPEASILFFPDPLNDIVPDWGSTTGGQRTSNYSWSGGFIRVVGEIRSELITKIAKPAKRGEHHIRVDQAEAEKIQPGDRLTISQTDTPDQSLIRYLYSGDCGDISATDPGRITQVVTVTRVSGPIIHFDRPLRFDLRMKWTPKIESYQPSVVEVGVEHLGFEFPNLPYEGHFTELGYNAATFIDVANCWIRNVQVVNCDSGFFIRSDFSTFTDIRFETSRRPDDRERNGHHGFYLQGSDNLLSNFDIDQRFIHDVSVGHRAIGNVISNGRGEDLTLDHHKHVPYENLFTQIDAGAGTRVWLSGGGRNLGKHCAARGTFWNIRAQSPIPPPPEVFGPPSMNFVGVGTGTAPEESDREIWWEPIPPESLTPPNLHEAQLRRRLARQDATTKTID